MKKIIIADATLRSGSAIAEGLLGFKEKINIVRQLERLHVDVIETAPLRNGKSDVLFLHSASSLVSSTLSCPAALNKDEVLLVSDAIKGAQHPRLQLLVPISTVQMEYQLHLKPAKVLETLETLCKLVKTQGCPELEVSLLDATRAEKDFLMQAVKTAIVGGADILTLCDSAGTMFPEDYDNFLTEIQDAVPELSKVTLSVECSDALHMASACAAVCLKHGVTQFKTAIGSSTMLNLKNFADLLRLKGRVLGVKSSLDLTVLQTISGLISEIMQGKTTSPSVTELAEKSAPEGVFPLSLDDNMESVAAAIRHLGYDLSADDLSKVYEEFRRIAPKKEIGSKELDAIVATVAVQAPPVYQLKSFVITSGNVINAMANVILEKNGQEVTGFSMGDGPVDAAFRSIENIIGRHFELDDFKISAVTEGRNAVGSGVVRLRSKGKLYSGKGVSTDIVGAAIRGYVNALNKICYDEEEKE